MAYQHIEVPAQGQKITVNADLSLNVPDQPIIPYIEGDGTGADIWRATSYVIDGAVAKSYGEKRKIHWFEVLAGDKATPAAPSKDGKSGKGKDKEKKLPTPSPSG